MAENGTTKLAIMLAMKRRTNSQQNATLLSKRYTGEIIGSTKSQDEPNRRATQRSTVKI